MSAPIESGFDDPTTPSDGQSMKEKCQGVFDAAQELFGDPPSAAPTPETSGAATLAARCAAEAEDHQTVYAEERCWKALFAEGAHYIRRLERERDDAEQLAKMRQDSKNLLRIEVDTLRAKLAAADALVKLLQAENAKLWAWYRWDGDAVFLHIFGQYFKR